MSVVDSNSNVSDVNTSGPSFAVFMSLNDAIEIMHKRLGHISRKRIKMMIDQGIISVMKGHKDEFYEKHLCRSCSSSKTPRPSYRKIIAKSKKAGVRWYMDLTGPYAVTSVNGNRLVLKYNT